MVALLVRRRVEQGACPVQGCLCPQSEDCKLVGPTVLRGAESIVPEICVVLYNLVLDGIALVENVLEHLVGAAAGKDIDLFCAHSLAHDGNTTVLAGQGEVEESPHKAALVLVVLVAVHLLDVVVVELELFEVQTLHLGKNGVAGSDSGIHILPGVGLGVAGAPGSVIEVLYGVAHNAVFAFVRSRSEHCAGAVVAEVVLDSVVDVGHKTAYIAEVQRNIVFIVDVVLVVVHLLAAGSGEDDCN